MVVKHVAKLANLPLESAEERKFQTQFGQTLDYVKKINELDTTGVSPTSQVTGLTNISRPDVVDTSRALTQIQALSGAHQAHNGYFVVPAIFNEH